jgi:RAP1 GTPase activating protein 1
VADDPLLGPALLSVKNELMAGQEHTRLVLRLKSGTQHELLPNSCIQQLPSPAKLAKVRRASNTKTFEWLFNKKRVAF